MAMKTFLIFFFCFATLHSATAQIVKNEVVEKEIIGNLIQAQQRREYLPIEIDQIITPSYIQIHMPSKIKL